MAAPIGKQDGRSGAMTWDVLHDSEIVYATVTLTG